MTTKTRIAVTGATGRLGRPLLDILTARGHEVVPMSRSSGVDLTTGEGVEAALEGVDVVIDAATGPSPVYEEAVAFFKDAARHLHAAAERQGVRRLVVVSIIGIDRFTGAYNASKQVQERLALEAPFETRIVRAAQFHEFVEQLAAWSTRGDRVEVRPMRTQLVAASAVAEHLADVALDPAGGPVLTEIGGPREERLADAFRLLLGDDVRIDEVPDPSDPDAERYVDGTTLPGPGAILAGPTYADWLHTAKVTL